MFPRIYRKHPVVHFLEPVFSHHNTEEVEISGVYADLEYEDPTAQSVQSIIRIIGATSFYLNDEQVAGEADL